MRILITGGCGFLGSHLVEHFLKTTDHDIVVLDKLTYASNGYDRLRDVRLGLPGDLEPTPSRHWADRVTVLNADLANPIAPGVLQEVGAIDYIIHAAAESHVDNSITDPLPFLMSNVIGTHHLLRSGLADRARRTILVSTDEVYGPADWEDDGATEWAPFRPANPYAASKAGAECLAFAYANTYSLPITIVNTMNLIGERQHPEKFVPLVIRKVLAGETVTIHANPTRTRPGQRFYLHCRTFANALAWLIDNEGSWAMAPLCVARGALKLHVCGERELSNLELAQAIAEFVGQPLKYELVDFHSSRPGHDLRYAMDDSRIRKLGWVRPMGIMASLKKTVAWYLANPKWLSLPSAARGDDHGSVPFRIPATQVREGGGGGGGVVLMDHSFEERTPVGYYFGPNCHPIKVGDRVWQASRDRKGTVTSVEGSVVCVQFDAGSLTNVVNSVDLQFVTRYPDGQEVQFGDRVVLTAPNTAEHGSVGIVTDFVGRGALVRLASGWSYRADEGFAFHSRSQPIESPIDDDRIKRSTGCGCPLQEGDSPCPVHGQDETSVPDRNRRERLQDAGWKVGDAEEFLDDIELEEGLGFVVPLASVDDEQFADGATALVGIFADPLGSDIERANHEASRDREHREQMGHLERRIVQLEIDAHVSKLTVGAKVATTGPAPYDDLKGEIVSISPAGDLRYGVKLTETIGSNANRSREQLLGTTMWFGAEHLVVRS